MVNPFDGTNSDLFNVAEQIELKTGELETAREKYLLVEAMYENEYSKFLLETKIKNTSMTQSEISAQAKVLTYQLKLEMIKAESSYKRLCNEIKALRDKLDSLKEVSYNLRRDRVQG